ncbi:hypothetical protein DFJ77DRAFT_438780 [Powellomyces hirtus]|nr:hypothetical protein DFJ77DRAFT_438780 [Powellomyces hirtus]
MSRSGSVIKLMYGKMNLCIYVGSHTDCASLKCKCRTKETTHASRRAAALSFQSTLGTWMVALQQTSSFHFSTTGLSNFPLWLQFQYCGTSSVLLGFACIIVVGTTKQVTLSGPKTALGGPRRGFRNLTALFESGLCGGLVHCWLLALHVHYCGAQPNWIAKASVSITLITFIPLSSAITAASAFRTYALYHFHECPGFNRTYNIGYKTSSLGWDLPLPSIPKPLRSEAEGEVAGPKGAEEENEKAGQRFLHNHLPPRRQVGDDIGRQVARQSLKGSPGNALARGYRVPYCPSKLQLLAHKGCNLLEEGQLQGFRQRIVVGGDDIGRQVARQSLKGSPGKLSYGYEGLVQAWGYRVAYLSGMHLRV